MIHLRNPVSEIKYAREQARLFAKTYSLLRKLSSINGIAIDADLLDRTMYNLETLPPLGKEYWWFLFFCEDRRQLMLLIYRKNGARALSLLRRQIRAEICILHTATQVIV